MALSGDLKDFSLLQPLTLVQVTHKTGALTLQRLGETAIIYFEDGELTRIEPPASRSWSLATALYRAGRIDQERYELINSQAPPSEQAVGLLLFDQGVLTQEEIVEFIRERSLADLYGLLTWPDGVFRFEVGVSPGEDRIAAPTDLGPILQKGRSFLEEWQLLVSHIPSLDRPLRLLSEPRKQPQQISLSPPEWRMVASLASDLPIKDVAQKLDLDEFGVRQVAFKLISSGLAEIPEPEFVPPPTTEQREPKEPEPAKPGGLARLFGRR